MNGRTVEILKESWSGNVIAILRCDGRLCAMLRIDVADDQLLGWWFERWVKDGTYPPVDKLIKT